MARVVTAVGLLPTWSAYREARWFPLNEAMQEGNVTLVKFLLEEVKIDPNKYYLWPSVTFAVKCSTEHKVPEQVVVNMIQLLLKHGVTKRGVTFYDEDIRNAVVGRKWKVLTCLLENSILNINACCPDGTPIKELIRLERPELLLIKYETNPFKHELFTLLYKLDEDGFINKIEYKREILNSVDHKRISLLQRAVQHNLRKVVQKLLSLGADPNYAHASWDSHRPVHPPPLVLAASYGLRDIADDLFKSGTLDLSTTYEGNTILHLLAQNELLLAKNIEEDCLNIVEKIVERTVKKGVDINAKNHVGKSALSYACMAKNIGFSSIFLKNGAFRYLTYEVLKNISSVEIIQLLDDLVNIFEYDNDSKCVVIKFNYSIFEIQHKNAVGNKDSLLTDVEFSRSSLNNNDIVSQVPELHALREISKSETHSHMLKHPVILFFIFSKWRKILPFYITNVFIFIMFTFFLTIYILQSISTNVSISIPVYLQNISWPLALFFTILVAIREVFQVCICIKQYFISIENWMEAILLIFTFYILLGDSAMSPQICVLVIFFTYSELTLLIGGHPSLSTYITLFLHVAKKSIFILLIFFPLVFAFALGFHIIFINDKKENTFANIKLALFKCFLMLVGEFGVEEVTLEINKSELLCEFFFIMFIVLIVIVLTNLLNALAIYDTKAIIEEAEKLSCITHVNFLYKLDMFCKSCLKICRLCKYCNVFIQKLFNTEVFYSKNLNDPVSYFSELKCMDTINSPIQNMKMFKSKMLGLDPSKLLKKCIAVMHNRVRTKESAKMSTQMKQVTVKLNNLQEQNEMIIKLLMKRDSEILGGDSKHEKCEQGNVIHQGSQTYPPEF